MMFHEIAVTEWEWSMTWWSDPIFFGKYPEDALEQYKGIVPDFPEEDMKLICQPLDFVGQNIYDGRMVEMGKDGKPVFSPEPIGFARTHMKSPVTPEILYWMPQFLYERYGKPVVVTENGISNGDLVSLDGKVHDGCRIAYLERYLQKLGEAAELVPVMGYFRWSFMDNFEWACGYQERFGLVYVDYSTQKRIMKDSGYWYADVIRTNGNVLENSDEYSDRCIIICQVL